MRKEELVKIVNAARARKLPPREALERIRGWKARGIAPERIAAKLNALKIRPPREDAWTKHSIKALLKLLFPKPSSADNGR